MKSFKKIYLITIAFIAAGVITSCSYDLEPNSDSNTPDPDLVTMLRAEVTMADYKADEPKTRLGINADDGWSYAAGHFADGDVFGVFARQGNMNLLSSDGKGGPLINIPMHVVRQAYGTESNPKSTMENDTIFVMPTSMNYAGVMMYYPYSPDMGSLANYPNWKEYPDTRDNAYMIWGDTYPDIPGIELRTLASDGSTRCKDILYMINASKDDLAKGLITGTIYHLFSEMVIMRGEGFDKPMQKVENPDGTVSLVPNESVTVLLNNPITHIRPVSYTSSGTEKNVRWTMQLFYKDGYTFNGEAMSEDEAKLWPAWKGNKFPQPTTEANPGQDAWYVLIPTVYYQNTSGNATTNQQYSVKPTVVEIQMYDNNGYLQHITNLELKADDSTTTPSKQPYLARKYAIQVAMDELGPTVRPVTIENWDMEGDDKDITEIRGAGIDDENDYILWAEAYNTYIKNGRTEQYAQALTKYGDMVDGGKMWNFYISPFEFTQEIPTINDLQDQIIGNNNFFNIEFKDLNLTKPLFSKISGNGGITNIDFISPVLNCDYDTPVGILAGTVVSQSGADPGVVFKNCNISFGKVINKGEGAVGLIAGSMEYGAITDCTVSGQPLGMDTADGEYEGVFGVTPQNAPAITSSDFNGIIYSFYNGGL